MVFGPRDAAELEVVTAVLAASHRYASTPAEGRRRGHALSVNLS